MDDEWLFDFLFEGKEKGGLEEFRDGDFQPVADFLHGGNGGGVVASADDIVQGGLGDTADERQVIDGNLALLTKLQNPLANRLSDGHSVPLVHGIGYCYGSGFVRN